MTNEELLAKIDEGGARAFQSDSYGWIALRAVVELHKPDGGICNHCEEGFIMGSIPVVYPCPTIQVIEKQLND